MSDSTRGVFKTPLKEMIEVEDVFVLYLIVSLVLMVILSVAYVRLYSMYKWEQKWRMLYEKQKGNPWERVRVQRPPFYMAIGTEGEIFDIDEGDPDDYPDWYGK